MSDPTFELLPTRANSPLFMVRVNPRNKNLTDPINHDPIFEDMWLVETNMGDDLVMPMANLRDQISELSGSTGSPRHRRLMAEYRIWSVLRHPDSPYGMGCAHEDLASGMVVMYHGRRFLRSDEGVLTEVKMPRLAWWPTRDEWRVTNFAVRLHLRRMGLLP